MTSNNQLMHTILGDLGKVISEIDELSKAKEFQTDEWSAYLMRKRSAAGADSWTIGLQLRWTSVMDI